MPKGIYLQHNYNNMYILEKLISKIAPHLCLQCNKEGELICKDCWPDVVSSVPSRCYKCFAQTENFKVCKKCIKQTGLRQVRVISTYNDLPKRLIGSMKFEEKRVGAEIIGKIIDEYLGEDETDTIFTHIPTAPVRIRKRGFDHVQLIVQTFTKSRGYKHQTLLNRHGKSRQVGSLRQDRKKQTKGLYSVKNPQQIKGKKIVIVDDVLTTGATIEEVAKILKRAGAKKVNGIIFAQSI